jgi:ABC-type phosphate/phosphonate transport system substrate-binding protein
MLLVDFPWYDAPFLKLTHDRLWSELRSRLQARVVGLPERRNSQIRHDDLLESEQLLLTQTCGFYVANNTPKFLNIVGTPVFELPDCPAGSYFSYFVSAKSSLDGELRLAVNDLRSWSGCHTLLHFCESENLRIDFGGTVVTGAHRASIAKLLSNECDIAAIDAVTWHLYLQNDPQFLRGLEIFGRSVMLAAPPYVTSAATTAETIEILFNGLTELIQSTPWVKEKVLLKGLRKDTHDTYCSDHKKYFSQLPIVDAPFSAPLADCRGLPS